jgi:hypothetical protein
MNMRLRVMAGVALAAAVVTWLVAQRDDPSFAGIPADSVVIAGVPQGIPRASAESESIAPAALEAASGAATAAKVRALIVHRSGHRVLTQFRTPADAARFLDGGELGAALFTLALQLPEEQATADAQLAAQLIHERIWLPLRAGEARLLLRTSDVPRRCCVLAQADDWMRFGDMLVGLGALRGERIVDADAARAVLAHERAATWRGDEPLASRDATWFDLGSEARLWLVPQRRLAVLVSADAEVAADTLIPNIILRGLDDQAPPLGGGIGDIVPGH